MRFECQTCDLVEVLSIWPDCCSSCRGRLVRLDGPEPDPWAFLDDLAADLFEGDSEPIDDVVGSDVCIDVVEYAPPCHAFGGVVASYAMVAVLAIGALYLLGRDSDAAMELCEQRQSFETCFLALNR